MNILPVLESESVLAFRGGVTQDGAIPSQELVWLYRALGDVDLLVAPLLVQVGLSHVLHGALELAREDDALSWAMALDGDGHVQFEQARQVGDGVEVLVGKLA